MYPRTTVPASDEIGRSTAGCMADDALAQQIIVLRFSIRTAKSSRSFRDIEKRARVFEAKIDTLPAGAVVAVQIGNHEDWPSIFIACLRKQLVVLPLDQSISEQQREAALKICGASAVVSTGPTRKFVRDRSAGRQPTLQQIGVKMRQRF